MMNDEMAAGTPGADQYQDGGAGGYCIKIHVSGTGQVQSVSVKPYNEEGEDGEQDGAEGMQERGQDVQSIDQALQVARQLYEQGGATARSDEQQAMDGYRGTGQRRNVAGIDDVFSRG